MGPLEEDVLAYVTFKRTYARRKENSNQTETFVECIDRVLRGCQQQLHTGFTTDEKFDLRSLFLSRKCSVAGRFLWQLGTPMVAKNGLMSLQNCAFVNIDDPVRNYCNMFDMLMLGTGVGYRFTEDVIAGLPVVRTARIRHCRDKDADFIVPDSRIGWCKLLGKVLKAHFLADGNNRDFTYSTCLLREKGEAIKTFGGVASGHECLTKGVEDVNRMLNEHAGTRASQLLLLDIGNIVGRIVIAGNVRRSALIAIGDPTEEYLAAKRWDTGNIPNYRAFSNNSIICNDIEELPDTYYDGFDGKGEIYGLLNLQLMKSCGRIGETKYRDEGVEGVNPCGEMSLEPGETCCLAEIFLPNITSYAELRRCVMYLYRICKHSLRLPCHIKSTEAIIHRNMRMGIGVTGYLQCTDEQKAWLSPMYAELRLFDATYSEQKGWPTSKKLTTLKPSGTLSILGGMVCSGVHPAFARYYIRRIRFSSDSPLLPTLRSLGYKMEFVKQFDGTEDANTTIVEFPVQAPKDAVLASECTAVQQLEHVKTLQQEWSDNAVSNTIYVRRDEVDEIKAWMRTNFNPFIKSVSFLLHSEHGFLQAPLEEISEAQYHQLVSGLKKMQTGAADFDTFFDRHEEEIELQTEVECNHGICPIR